MSFSVFESFKFSIKCNKICGYLFFTLKSDASEKITSSTTLWDLMIFLLSLTFTITSVVSVWEIPVTTSSRSVIINIGLFLVFKFATLHPLIMVLLNFYFRHDWFEILNAFHWIDEKVRKN